MIDLPILLIAQADIHIKYSWFLLETDVSHWSWFQYVMKRWWYSKLKISRLKSFLSLYRFILLWAQNSLFNLNDRQRVRARLLLLYELLDKNLLEMSAHAQLKCRIKAKLTHFSVIYLIWTTPKWRKRKVSNFYKIYTQHEEVLYSEDV